jgi:sulfur-carrier protein
MTGGERSMHVKVKLFGSLAAMVPGATSGVPLRIELPPRSHLGDISSQLRLPAGEQKLLFVNGRAEEADHLLEEGDEVGIFPPVGGG